MTDHDPLEAYLERRSEEEFELGFDEMERILGKALPDGASRPAWWADEGERSGNSRQDASWRRAGYEAFLLPQGRVLFRRRAPKP